jgi:hypothetical protein
MWEDTGGEDVNNALLFISPSPCSHFETFLSKCKTRYAIIMIFLDLFVFIFLASQHNKEQANGLQRLSMIC